MDSQKEQMQIWIDALRSGKYIQTKGKLRSGTEDAFCCLGIACHISGLGKWKWLDTTRQSYITDNRRGGYTSSLPVEVAEYYGIDEEVEADLADKNDKGGYSFEAIADYLEERFITNE